MFGTTSLTLFYAIIRSSTWKISFQMVCMYYAIKKDFSPGDNNCCINYWLLLFLSGVWTISFCSSNTTTDTSICSSLQLMAKKQKQSAMRSDSRKLTDYINHCMATWGGGLFNVERLWTTKNAQAIRTQMKACVHRKACRDWKRP